MVDQTSPLVLPWFTRKTTTNNKNKTNTTQTKSQAGSWIEGQVATMLESYPFRSTATIATLQVWTLALSCCSKTPFEHLPRRFHGLQFSASITSLHSICTLVIVLLLGKKSNIITPFASQNTVALASRWPCLEILWPRGPRPYPLKTLELYSLAHNYQHKSHLQSPDAKENQLLT